MKKLLSIILLIGLLFADSTSVVIYQDSVGFVTKEFDESFAGGTFEKTYRINADLSDLYISLDSGTLYSYYLESRAIFDSMKRKSINKGLFTMSIKIIKTMKTCTYCSREYKNHKSYEGLTPLLVKSCNIY